MQDLIPRPPLLRFVARLWDWHAPVVPVFGLERVLPTPTAGIIINLFEDETRSYALPDTASMRRGPASVFEGPRTRSQIIDTAEQVAVMGVIFQPGAAAAFMRDRADLLCDGEVGLDALFGRHATSLREQLLEAGSPARRLGVLSHWLEARLPGTDPMSAQVAHAVRLIRAAPQAARVDALVRGSGLSARRFGQLFREQVGMGAKRFARVCRFQSLVQQLHGPQAVRWAEVALDAGLHDQAHLVHEFKAFSGLTPTAYMAQVGAHPHHVPL